MTLTLCFLVFVTCINIGIGNSTTNAHKFEPYVVGGDFAKITRYPHMAYMLVSCQSTESLQMWACGGSILNQRVILTAGHCVEDCLPSSVISVSVGSAKKTGGTKFESQDFRQHEHYDGNSIANDIALVKVNTDIQLGKKVKRVVIMRHPPLVKNTVVAGWGLVDEDSQIGTVNLKMALQKVWRRSQCLDAITTIPDNTICAVSQFPIDSSKYGTAAQGDSGSALIARDYIQIGIVSYKNPRKAVNIIIYTDVSRYFDWITATAKIMVCDKKRW